MRTRRRYAALAIVLGGLAIQAVAHAEVTDEEYAVYQALLQQVEWRSGKGAEAPIEQYVIRESTRAAVLSDRSKIGLDPSTVSMFEARNHAIDRLDARRFVGIKVRLVSNREYEASFWSPAEGPMTFDGRTFRNAPASRDAFYQKYRASQGLLTLSRVGFSEDGRRALLSYDNETRDRGEGGLVLFEKTPEGWKIGKWLGSWVSS